MDDQPDDSWTEALQGDLTDRQMDVLQRIEAVVTEVLLDLSEGRLPLTQQACSPASSAAAGSAHTQLHGLDRP